MQLSIFVSLVLIACSAANPPSSPDAANPPAGGPVDCSVQPDGNYAMFNEKNNNRCSGFYITCDGGLAITRRCPSELRFDSISGDCLSKSYVRACGGESTTTLSPEELEQIQQDQPTPQPVPFDCADEEDGNYLLDDEPCSNVFFQCVGGVATMINCPTPGLRFSTEMDACVAPSLVSACQNSAAYYGSEVQAYRDQPTEATLEEPQQPVMESEPTVDPASCGSAGYDSATGRCFQNPPQPVTEEQPAPQPTEPVVVPTTPAVDPASCGRAGYDAIAQRCFPEIQPEEPIEQDEEPIIEEPVEPVQPEVDPASCDNGYNPVTRRCIQTPPAQVPQEPEECGERGYNARTGRCNL